MAPDDHDTPVTEPWPPRPTTAELPTPKRNAGVWRVAIRIVFVLVCVGGGAGSLMGLLGLLMYLGNDGGGPMAFVLLMLIAGTIGGLLGLVLSFPLWGLGVRLWNRRWPMVRWLAAHVPAGVRDRLREVLRDVDENAGTRANG